MAKAKKENELRLVRVFDAPVKLVWQMWTEDEHVKKWYGPRGFSYTTKSKEIKVGGKWIFTMHGPDGVDWLNVTTYLEVEPYKKLVYDHGGNEEREALFRVTVTFEEFKGKTVMDMTMSFATIELATQIKQFVKDAQGDATWDRLAEHLEEVQTKKDVFIINRSFTAPQKLVFDMWTNPEQFAKWMGPTGATMEIINATIKEGASLQYKMFNADGSSMFGKVNYLKIHPHDLLIYTQNFCDENGKLKKPPFTDLWPDMMLTTVTFTDEGDNETRVTLRWEVYGEASDAERDMFHQAKDGMTLGWWGSFNKLEELISDTH